MVPDFQSFFKPLIQLSEDGALHSLKEARDAIASQMKLSGEDLNQLLPSGVQKTFDNRVAWAKSYLIQAGVFSSPKRAHFQITSRGRELLEKGLERIDVKVLNQYPEFREFHQASNRHDRIEVPENTPNLESLETPEEILQKAYQSIRRELVGEVLERIKSNSPSFFESLVVDLMIALGYGGSRADAGRSIGQSGDEGVDGIINEDRLGLDVIYLQAKRWDGTVGRPEIQRFVGALHGKRAKKGVFITTGKFSVDATEYVKNIDPKIILIDGRSLAEYMIDFSLGTSTVARYEIKRIDSDYFSEE
jgi:restriction system protein